MIFLTVHVTFMMQSCLRPVEWVAGRAHTRHRGMVTSNKCGVLTGNNHVHTDNHDACIISLSGLYLKTKTRPVMVIPVLHWIIGIVVAYRLEMGIQLLYGLVTVPPVAYKLVLVILVLYWPVLKVPLLC